MLSTETSATDAILDEGVGDSIEARIGVVDDDIDLVRLERNKKEGVMKESILGKHTAGRESEPGMGTNVAVKIAAALFLVFI